MLVSVTVSGLRRSMKIARGGAGPGGHRVPTQGACGPSSNQAPEGHTATAADWDAVPRKSTQEKRAQLDRAEGAPGCTGGASLGPWGRGTGGGSPDCRLRCPSMPWGPDQACEWRVHLAVAGVRELPGKAGTRGVSEAEDQTRLSFRPRSQPRSPAAPASLPGPPHGALLGQRHQGCSEPPVGQRPCSVSHV